MTVSVDMDAVVQQTIRQFGARNAELVLELNAQRAVSEQLQKRIEELSPEGAVGPVAGGGAERADDADGLPPGAVRA